jgi:hypothetical protein
VYKIISFNKFKNNIFKSQSPTSFRTASISPQKKEKLKNLEFQKQRFYQNTISRQRSHWKNLALFSLGLNSISLTSIGIFTGFAGLSLLSLVTIPFIVIPLGYFGFRSLHKGQVTNKNIKTLIPNFDNFKANDIKTKLRKHNFLSSKLFRKNVVLKVPNINELKNILPDLSISQLMDIQRIIQTNHNIKHNQSEKLPPQFKNSIQISPDAKLTQKEIDSKSHEYKKMAIALDTQKDLEDMAFWRGGMVGLWVGHFIGKTIVNLFSSNFILELIGGFIGSFAGNLIGSSADMNIRKGFVSQRILKKYQIAKTNQEANNIRKILRDNSILTNHIFNKNKTKDIPTRYNLKQWLPNLNQKQLDSLVAILEVTYALKK